PKNLSNSNYSPLFPIKKPTLIVQVVSRYFLQFYSFSCSSFNTRNASSNCSSISKSCLYVILLTTIVTIRFKTNAGKISYNVSDKKLILPHTATITAPVIIPANAPVFVTFFQYKDKMTSAPNAPPKPAQANDTSPKIVSLLGHANPTATIETINTAIRPKNT